MTDAREAPVVLSAPPTSYTAFKPVGHIVIGFADVASGERARQALADAGVEGVQQVASAEMRSKMAQMLDVASGSAEFGHEIVAMRRFLSLSAEGYGWLIVPAADDSTARGVIATVEPLGARVAVRYDRLIVSDLL
jgi:hypothetical protein